MPGKYSTRSGKARLRGTWKRAAAQLAANEIGKYVRTNLGKRKRNGKAQTKFKKRKGGDTKWAHDHDGIKMSKHKIVLNSKTTKRKVSSWNSYLQQNSDLYTGAAGAQLFSLMTIDFSQHQLNEVDVTPTNGARPNQYTLPLFNFNTGQAYQQTIAAGNALATPYSGSGKVVGQDMYIKSVDYDFQITNASNGACVVDIYCVVTKQKPPQGTASLAYSRAWNPSSSGLMEEVASMVLFERGTLTGAATKQVAAQPIQQAVPTSSVFGDLGLTSYGFNPFQIKGFRKAYKCKFHKKLSMDAGATHKFDIKCHVNKWISEEMVRLNGASITDNVYSGLTMQWFVIARGQPGVVEQDGVVPNFYDRQVTPIAVQLAVTHLKKINFGFGPGNSSKASWLAPNFSLLGTGATTKIYNSEDAEVVATVIDPTDAI